MRARIAQLPLNQEWVPGWRLGERSDRLHQQSFVSPAGWSEISWLLVALRTGGYGWRQVTPSWETRWVGCEVVLVRHAESVIPVPGGPGDFERGLTGQGVAQAERLAAELAGFEPAAVVSSPYLRAVQTVEPAARRLGLPVAVDRALREWDSGLEPRPDFLEHYGRSWADLDFVRPGGESLAELSVRAVAALRALVGAYDGGVVVVGSHGTFVCRALAGFGVRVDWPFSRAMPMPAVYRLSLDGDRARAVGPGL